MQHSPPSAQSPTKQEIVDRFRAIAPRFAGRAEAAERARKIPSESVQEMLAAGLARILVPCRFDGYGLDFDTWFDAEREPPGYDQEHGDRAYLAPTGALSLNWNSLGIYLRPAESIGAPATIANAIAGAR